jgi:eukaryotic-like serine/threonine-protein kinase
MICPSCKRDNAPFASRCAHCQAVLPAPASNAAPDSEAASTGNKTPKQPTPEIRPVPRIDPGDLTIENAPNLGRAREPEGPGVSILSKTPSGAIPPRDSRFDNLDPNTLMGNEGISPGSPVSRTPTSFSRVGNRSTFGNAPEPGEDFGTRFRIEKLLGAGGMGKVYKAFDKELSRMVALKTLQPELVSDPTVIQRFKQELLLASKISHKNILRIHDLNDFEGTKYITMAFIEGRDLSQILKEEGPLSLDRCLKIIRQLCEALDAAHSEGVVHRDFKPHNVLVGKDDQVYVSDFGLATSLESAQMGMTRSGAVVGTPRYMSPEQVEGKRVDSRTDIYSLGIVFYEMVTGQVPFSGESTWQLMYQRVQQTPIDVKQVKPDLPDYIARVIMHCLEKDPANRYQSAKEIVADLDANRSPSLSTTYAPSRTMQINIPVVHNRWWFPVVVGGIVLVTVFFAVPKTRHLIIPPSKTAISTTSASVNGLPSIAKGKYVAVLPFRVIGDQAAYGYVADGVVESISAKLFQIKDVHMAAPAAAAKVDPKASLPQVAKELGVNLIVHGTVQGKDDNLRISVNLENMAENRLVWSQEFAGVNGDLLTLEDQIYGHIVDALEAKPTSAELAATSAHPTENIEAYNFYLRGRNAITGNVDDATAQAAMNFYNQALQKDPAFALAYAGLADANLVMYSQKKDKFWSDKAIEAAKKAESLNAKLPEVHFTLGSVYSATGQTVQSIAENKRALELAPNSDEAYRRLGNAYIANNQKAEALRALEKAVELNPYYWNNLTALANAYHNFGEDDKAAKLYSQTIQLEPDNPAGYSNLAMVYFSQGKYEESIASFQKALQLKPTAAIYSNLGTAFFYLKRYPEALSMFEKAVEMNPTNENLGNLADGYRLVGNKEKAQGTYERAIKVAFQDLKVNPRNAEVAGNLALYFAKKGDLEQARDFIKRARNLDHSSLYLMYAAAVVDTIDNKPSDAIKELKDAVAKGFSPQDVATDPEFTSLRDRPEFKALISKSTPKPH